MIQYNYNSKIYDVKGVETRINHINDIKSVQLSMKDNLEFRDGGLTVIKPSSKIELSKGCQACKTGTWWCLFVGYFCNLNCKFCSQEKSQELFDSYSHPRTVAPYWINDVKSYMDIYGKSNKVTGISYSGGEPFYYIDKIVELANYASEHTNWYQWIYTNGTLVTETKMKQLAKAGIKEIRFDLAATNFDSRVLNIVEKASSYFERITVEIPALPEVEQKLINENYLKTLENIGVTQLNLAELQILTDLAMEVYGKNNLIYIHDTKLTSDISFYDSRFITYRIMKYAIDNKIDILINDCSLDAKHLQCIMRADNLPTPLK